MYIYINYIRFQTFEYTVYITHRCFKKMYWKTCAPVPASCFTSALLYLVLKFTALSRLVPPYRRAALHVPCDAQDLHIHKKTVPKLCPRVG